jgi:hypothetical protein
MTKVDLLARLEALTGPDRQVDADIHTHLMLPGAMIAQFPRYTGSLEAAVALVEQMLPGWWWRVGTCCVSDDAIIGPDFNSPIHGGRLKGQLFPVTRGSEFDAGFDVDRRPPGNLPIALLEVLFRALIAIEEKSAI